MTISELIEQLKSILEQHGDMDVKKSYADEYGYIHDVIVDVEKVNEYVVLT